MRKELVSANRSAYSALVELQFSKSKIDSICSDMNVLKGRIKKFHQFVDLNDARKSLEKKVRRGKKALKQRIDSLKDIINYNSELPVIREAKSLKQQP